MTANPPPTDERERQRDDPRRRKSTTTRRGFLAATSILGATGLAGCLGSAPPRRSPEAMNELPASVARSSFTRLDRGPLYRLAYRWFADGEEWTTEIDVSKDSYVAAAESDRSIADVFDDARESDAAARLARAVAEQFDAANVAEPRERLGLLTEFARGLRYVTDEADAGTTEYPKYVEETLVENAGDCEDLATVLAGVLAAEPFAYDPVLVVFAGHAGVGVDPDALDAAVPTVAAGDESFFYLEPTYDTDLGAVPDAYRGRDVIATYDDGWRVRDADALVEHLRRSAFGDDSVSPLKYL